MFVFLIMYLGELKEIKMTSNVIRLCKRMDVQEPNTKMTVSLSARHKGKLKFIKTLLLPIGKIIAGRNRVKFDISIKLKEHEY